MKFAKTSFLACAALLVATTAASAPQSLADYLGTGTNPRIKLTLSTNGANWTPYTIDYQGIGNVPYTTNTATNYSTWDAKDPAGNYYGTITLKSNGGTVTWGGYSSSGSNYLQGIHFGYNNTGANAYQLTVDKIQSPYSATGVTLADYLGTGANPRLQLKLGANGPNYGTYTIDYQGIGNIPFSTNSSQNWSTFDVKDTGGNYYGTITLTSDGFTSAWSSYSAGTQGYYLKDISFGYNPGAGSYQLTVARVITPTASDSGPFPTTPLASPAVYPGTSNPVVLSVSGRQIVNNKGVPIVLRGLVRPSLEFNPQGQFLSPADVVNIAKWKGNVLRLDLNQAYWLASGPVTQTGSYRQIVDAMIYHAIQNKMAVILDLHLTQVGGSVPTTPGADSNSLTFWTQVATEYKNFGTVIFELFNEPHDGSAAVWRNGGSVQVMGTGPTYQIVGHQALLNAVRNTGANNICIVNGEEYGYDLSFINGSNGLTGGNVVYGSHPYNEKGRGSNTTQQGGNLDANLAGVLPNYPVIFTEFGSDKQTYYGSSADYVTVYARNIAYANAQANNTGVTAGLNNTTYKISYTGFAWWVDPDPAKRDAFPDLISDFSGTAVNGGSLIYDDMATNNTPKAIDAAQ